MIIINGRNYFASDIESTVRSEIKPFAERTIAAFAVHDAKSDTEKLYVAIESSDPADEELAKDVRNAVLSNLHIPCKKVVFMPAIPKTSSGKVRYYLLTRQYEEESRKAESVYLPHSGCVY